MAAGKGQSGVDRASLRRVRSLLKRLPETAREEMSDVLHLIGRDELTSQRAQVPRKTGALAAGLSYRVSEKSLRLRVGLIGKRLNRDLFYGRIVEKGRVAKTVSVHRYRRGGREASLTHFATGEKYRQRVGGGNFGKDRRFTQTYQMKVRAMRARPFIFYGGGAARVARSDRLKNYWAGVLERVVET